MKKRVLSILLAMSVMATAFTGCGAGDEKAKTNAEISDWSTAYDDYFDEHQILRDGSRHTASTSLENMPVTIVKEFSGKNAYLSHDFGVASMALYYMDDTLYSDIAVDDESTWTYAPINSVGEWEDFINSNDTAMGDFNIVSWIYKEEIIENGVVYDKLGVATKDDDGEYGSIYCYVNRETQKIDKYTIYEDGIGADYVVEDIDKIVLPPEAEYAQETTFEEISASQITLMLLVAMANAAE